MSLQYVRSPTTYQRAALRGGPANTSEVSAHCFSDMNSLWGIELNRQFYSNDTVIDKIKQLSGLKHLALDQHDDLANNIVDSLLSPVPFAQLRSLELNDANSPDLSELGDFLYQLPLLTKFGIFCGETTEVGRDVFLPLTSWHCRHSLGVQGMRRLYRLLPDTGTQSSSRTASKDMRLLTVSLSRCRWSRVHWYIYRQSNLAEALRVTSFTDKFNFADK